jgi:type VI secretion system protein VasJ
MVWDCLEALGADAAKQELEIQLAWFLQRVTGVAELRFQNGSDFADAATRDWIATYVMPHLEPAQPVSEIEYSVVLPEWDAVLQEAKTHLRGGGLKPAIQKLKQGLRNAQGGREQLYWRLTMARLCYNAKKYDLAKAQLEALDYQLQQSSLHLWEPKVTLEILQLLYGCYGLLPPSHEFRERNEQIYRRLCHLDLEVVLE